MERCPGAEAEVAALDAKVAAAEQRLREAAAAAVVLERQAEEAREAQRQRLAACKAAWAAQRTVLEGRLQSEEAQWADERSALREQLRDSEARWGRGSRHGTVQRQTSCQERFE